MDDSAKNMITFLICATIAIVTLIGAIWSYNIKAEQQRVELYRVAIERGVTPMELRCAFEHSSQVDDELCTIMLLASPERAQQFLEERL